MQTTYPKIEIDPVDTKKKAHQFTFDSKVFIRSFSDAVICTKQIATFNADNDAYFEILRKLNFAKEKNNLLVAKLCDHEVCNTNLIASKSLESYEYYYKMKFSMNLFLNYYEKFKDINDYFMLMKALDKMHKDLKRDLKDYLVYIKNNDL